MAAPRLATVTQSLVVALAATCTVPVLVTGQEHALFLPAEHWSRDALQRLAGEGLLDLAEVGWAWPLRLTEVEALFEDAERSTGPTGHSARYGYRSRLAKEFGRAEDTPFRYTVRTGPYWATQEGGLLGGRTYWVEGQGWTYPGPVPEGQASFWSERLEAAFMIGGRAGATLRMRRPDSELRVDEAFVDVDLGPLTLWGGRRALALGPSPRGGLVLSGTTPLGGGGVSLPDGFRLPWFLGALGPVRLSAQLARMDRNGAVANPWFAAARASFDIRPSVTLGLNRATIFGGAGNREELTFRNVALMFIGITGQLGKSSGFENQVASLDLQTRFRLADVPLRLDAEWGFDDIGGAWTNVPGLILTLEAPHLGRSGLTVAAEGVYMAPSCCGNPEWYRHGGLGDGWTDQGRLLGHPLAGHGSEWSLALHWSDGAWDLGARGLRRWRGEENLFSPNWEGASLGGELSVSAWIGGQLEAAVQGAVEQGESGWRTWNLETGVFLTLGGRW